MAKSHPIPKDVRFIDLTGRMFGRWIVVSYAGKRGKNSHWNCRCECGNDGVVHAGNLTSGKSACCGCVQYEKLTKRNTKHGLSGHPLYGVWTQMKARCQWSSHPQFRDWGGRGIKVCDRWNESFEAFLADVGERPTPRSEIDRINNDGDYEPGNVRWSERQAQMRNMRRNRIVTFNGQQITLAEAIEASGIPGGRVHGRLRIGWSEERALSAPRRPHAKK